jgi:hypothetical protein
MYEVTNGTRKVKRRGNRDMEARDHRRQLLSVEAGTNGYQGGDTGHGSRTYIRIQDEGGTDIGARVLLDSLGYVDGVEIVLGGDAELSTMIEALKFVIQRFSRKAYRRRFYEDFLRQQPSRDEMEKQ